MKINKNELTKVLLDVISGTSSKDANNYIEGASTAVFSNNCIRNNFTGFNSSILATDTILPTTFPIFI